MTDFVADLSLKFVPFSQKKWVPFSGVIFRFRGPSYVNASKSTFSLEFERLYLEIYKRYGARGGGKRMGSSTRVENLTRLFY